MNINDFDFDLPEELIAQTPLKNVLAMFPKRFPLQNSEYLIII
ncbi:hypothetical protein ACQUED_01535 [Lactococcus lactis]